MNRLDFSNLKGDITGGLTAAVVALPLALAMGVSSGAGPIAGLYGAILVGFFAALFGGTPAQVSGPTGPMTVVMAAVITQYTTAFPDDPSTGLALAFTTVVLGGVFQMGFGFLKLGRFINLIPNPVISGFMTGIGVIIIFLQIPPLFGYPALPGPMASMMTLPDVAREPVIPALGLSLFTLLLVYLTPRRVNQILPAPLLALAAGTLGLVFWQGGDIQTVQQFDQTRYLLGGVSVLGNIPSGLPALHWPVFQLEWVPQMIQSGLMLAVLGSLDSLLTSLVADNITRTYHDSNRELIGQGLGNTIAGLFGGLPGAGATMRTVVNVRAGGRTPLSGALHAVVLLMVVLGAGKYARYIPHAVLAGILIKVGTDIIDWDYLRRIRQAPKAGLMMMLTVFVLTVFVDLITAVAVGMVMAAFVFMQRMVDLQLDSIVASREPDEELPLNEREKQLMQQAQGHVLLFHLGTAMSFGAAKGMARRLAQYDGYDVLVLDLTDVPQIDFTSSMALIDMVDSAESQGKEVILAVRNPQVRDMLQRQGVKARVCQCGAVVHDREAALEEALKRLEAADPV